VRLPSRYTSTASNDLAQEQAQALGVRLLTLPIEATVAAALQTLAPAIGEPPGLVAENLQSRARGVLLMGLSNASGALLLATGNKSEVAVGYCTLYGDTCGGYAPLKDLYKTDAFALARWRNAQGDGVRIPESVIARAPSAELRENQRDADSLPPYPVLDALLDQYLEGGLSAAQLVAAGFELETVTRVLRLVRISEWKRAQGAPGPRLSRSAFGSVLHMPVTSGSVD
jgi:NAD+ synthetase